MKVLSELYRFHFHNERRERLFLASLAFLLTFGIVRAITSSIASLTAILFGVGAALTLDEFALWLNLQDVYWERQGRVSVDVVLIFAGLLSVGIWGGPFFNGLVRSLLRLERSVG